MDRHQTYRQINRQIDRQIDRYIDIQIYNKYRYIDSWINRATFIEFRL